jgi:hypothetical protein
MAFQDLHLPVALCRPLGPEGLDAATRAQLTSHLHVVFVVHSHPRNAQLVAQCIVEIKRCAVGVHVTYLLCTACVVSFPMAVDAACLMQRQQAGLLLTAVRACAGCSRMDAARPRRAAPASRP